MDDKLTNYVHGVFAPYDGVKSAAELKADLLADLQERFRELKAEGKDDETAFDMTIESIGDIEQTVQEVAHLSRSLERQVAINLSASNLPQSDFAGVVAQKSNFQGSALRGSDFTGADLTGSSFRGSDVREANFAGANLTDCNFSTLDLRNANFREAILVRTNFSMSGLDQAAFINVTLTDVNLTMTNLRKTIFERCRFLRVNFTYSDLRGLRFDGQTFIGVMFGKASLNDASFRGATLKQVSFLPGFTLSKKYYRALKTISFDGAMMDKITYAALKGLDVDVSKVIILA
ncbi:hypothetical protein KSD_55690 [Ktedonobacter sp. SOSP1-85]|uniref:pentapeptide repeat-containing protein n=1 Tax=Ktedonobacter sp. SOSP1-85 TaxID=2778367 RepID=UPI001916B916|nr:pentapeptide repeat-containing protein [Ktedonobacter sp. SOSP1-85]GHO77798.1 hypothetical protein KSD_55690 [Ktedonobacter sp. SOSP1-85]